MLTQILEKWLCVLNTPLSHSIFSTEQLKVDSIKLVLLETFLSVIVFHNFWEVIYQVSYQTQPEVSHPYTNMQWVLSFPSQQVSFLLGFNVQNVQSPY